MGCHALLHALDLPDPGIETAAPVAAALQVDSLISEPLGKPKNTGDLGLIFGFGRPGGRHGSPPKYSCQENPMDRGAWQATIQGVTKSQTWTRLSD